MKIYVTEWVSAIQIPRADKMLADLHAFLTTSEQGVWEVDESEAADPSALHYRRGPWERSFFGLGRRMYPAPFHRVTSSYPMRLSVTLRPSAADTTITTCHHLLLRGLRDEDRREQEERKCWDGVVAEMNALAAYLHKAYNLPSRPRILECHLL